MRTIGRHASGLTLSWRLHKSGLGGLILLIIFVNTTISSLDPEFGSGAQVGGVGLVFIMGGGVIALGVLVMIVAAFFFCPFFRGEVLRQGTPHLQIEGEGSASARSGS